MGQIQFGSMGTPVPGAVGPMASVAADRASQVNPYQFAYPTQNGLPYDPEVSAILANPFGSVSAGSPGPRGSGMTGGMANGASTALSTYGKLARFLPGSMSGPAALGGASAAMAGGIDGAGTMIGSQLGLGGVFGPASQYGAGTVAASAPGDVFGTSLFGAGAGGGGSAGGAATAGATAGEAAGGMGGMAGMALPIATAAPFLLAAGGMLGGILGYSDDGTPYSQANDAWTSAVAKDPTLFQKYGQGDVNGYMQGQFGGSSWTADQYNQAKARLAAASGGGAFLGNAFGAAEQGGGG